MKEMAESCYLSDLLPEQSHWI